MKLHLSNHFTFSPPAILSSRLAAAVLLLTAFVLVSLPATARASACGDAYTVKRGDYWIKIANHCGVSFAELKAANKDLWRQRRKYIRPGDRMTIPGRVQPHFAGAPESESDLSWDHHISPDEEVVTMFFGDFELSADALGDGLVTSRYAHFDLPVKDGDKDFAVETWVIGYAHCAPGARITLFMRVDFETHMFHCPGGEGWGPILPSFIDGALDGDVEMTFTADSPAGTSIGVDVLAIVERLDPQAAAVLTIDEFEFVLQ